MIVLGINDMSRDASACVVKDGKLLAAEAEERVARIKHCGGFPHGAIQDVLRIAGLEAKDVDRIAVGNTSAEALMRFSTHVLGTRDVRERTPTSVGGYLTTGPFMLYRRLTETVPFAGSVDRALSRTLLYRRLRHLGFSAQIDYHDHHLSHAASAFLTSGFRKALVLTLDAYGDGRSGGLFLGRGDSLEELASFPPEVSLGEFYGAITTLLGYRFGSDEGKTMALAALGTPSLTSLWDRNIRVVGTALKGDLTQLRRFTYSALSGLKGKHRSEDIAASAQAILDEKVSRVVENAIEETGCTRLCLAGGVALNVKMNLRLMQLEEVKDIHVFPAPADDGTAVGAALLSSLSETRHLNRAITSAALGPSYTEEDIEAAIRSHPKTRDIVSTGYDTERTARELASGKLVGWFQGKMELGPRALGQRSLLADPTSMESSARIRRTIKRRPEFQPFCPSISQEYAKELLYNSKGIRAQFMTLAFPTREIAAEKVPAIVHVDSTSRPQVVLKSANRQYLELIHAFGEVSGIEGVLNTSLNRSGNPIVRSPDDALDLLLNTDLNMVVLGGTIVRRPA